MELASDFSEFCASLNANHVEYLIVGAYAMALHGVPRYTGDLDIFIRPTPDNGARLLKTIRDSDSLHRSYPPPTLSIHAASFRWACRRCRSAI